MTDSRQDPLPAAGSPEDAAGTRQKEHLLLLFGRLAEGETSALGAVYAICAEELYGLALWRTGSTSDAADVVQEVFVRLATRRHRLRAIAVPRAYLRRMAHSAAVDVHRRKARRREEPLEACGFIESLTDSPERSTDARRVSRLLARLPAAQREAIYLRHFAGCSFAEIGRATGVPTFTAASRYRIGMRRLRRLTGVKS